VRSSIDVLLTSAAKFKKMKYFNSIEEKIESTENG
jgi:hypothetical protein